MKRTLLLFVLAALLIACNRRSLQSPDGVLTVSFRLAEGGTPQYAVTTRDKKPILQWSALGLETTEADLTRGFRLIDISRSSCDTTWETVWGEERFIRDNHNEMCVRLSHPSGIDMNILFRAFNDGFAFRYELIPDNRIQTATIPSFIITDEASEYRFTGEAQAWSIPWRTEYYEGLWEKRDLTTSDTLCSPITVELHYGTGTEGDGRMFAFMHEAALTDFPAQNFYIGDGALRTYLTPWRKPKLSSTLSQREADRDKEVKAYVHLPFSTPWRFVVLTETLPELVASRIMLNLNDPCQIKDTSWIRPMKFMGIWWGMHIKTMTWEQGPKHGATTANMERYLRFAKEHHIDAVLAEGWNKGWEDWQHFSFTEPYDDWDMEYLTLLADSLGVQIIGHNETGGNAADYEAVLDEAYTYHAKHGIHAIKTGYVAPIIRTADGLQWNKGQSGVRHYRKVIETAAKYHIAIDNHEPVMPTGLQRTYPNLMSQEGVRGQEWNAWSADGGSPCEHVTVLPYTRILAGPVDYTPGVFRFENPVIPTTRVHSTLMNQLGLFVCLYSPLQMVCDLPEHYMEYPDAFRFIEHVPCDWERSLLVDGEIGDYCVFARQERGSGNWYIGGITDEQARDVTVPLTFLQGASDKTYTLTLYRDDDDADWENNPYAYVIDEMNVCSGDTVYVHMASGGGFAAELSPVK